MTTLTMNAPLIAIPKRKEEPAMPDFVGLRTDIGDLRRLFITLYLTGLGVTLAAFYAFASYIKG